MQRHMFTLLYC